MKKLMILAAVAMATVGLQAAKIDWQLNAKDAIKHHDGTSLTGSEVVYLIYTGSADYDNFVKGLSDGSINAGNIANQTSVYLGSANTKADTAGMTDPASSLNRDYILAVAGGGKYDTQFVYFDTDASKDWYYLSNVVQGQAWDDVTTMETLATKATFTAKAYSQGKGTWNEVTSAPEPTSAMLLLLGVAGLALKRKRA